MVVEVSGRLGIRSHALRMRGNWVFENWYEVAGLSSCEMKMSMKWRDKNPT